MWVLQFAVFSSQYQQTKLYEASHCLLPHTATQTHPENDKHTPIKSWKSLYRNKLEMKGSGNHGSHFFFSFDELKA
jgi:hypothetical protein